MGIGMFYKEGRCYSKYSRAKMSLSMAYKIKTLKCIFITSNKTERENFKQVGRNWKFKKPKM